MRDKNNREFYPRPPQIIKVLATWLYAWSKQDVFQQYERNQVSDNSRIRVVAISDTHSTESQQLPVPVGDILIHAGDLTAHGTFEEVDSALSWLAAQPHPHKIWIAGNHDRAIDPKQQTEENIASTSLFNSGNNSDGRSDKQGCNKQNQLITSKKLSENTKLLMDKYPSLTYLQDSSTLVNVRGREMKIFGNPGTPRYGSPAFSYARISPRMARSAFAHFGPGFDFEHEGSLESTSLLSADSTTLTCPNSNLDDTHQDNLTRPNDQDISANNTTEKDTETSGTEIWSKIPLDTDILVTHAPPRHILDDGQGCAALLAGTWRVKPTLHVFGHIHTGHGRTYVTWSREQEAYEKIMDDCYVWSDFWTLWKGMFGVLTRTILSAVGYDSRRYGHDKEVAGSISGATDSAEVKTKGTILVNVASKNRHWDKILRGATVIDI